MILNKFHLRIRHALHYHEERYTLEIEIQQLQTMPCCDLTRPTVSPLGLFKTASKCRYLQALTLLIVMS